MSVDQIDPNGKLATAILKAIEVANAPRDSYGCGLTAAVIALASAFEETQGQAEYASWFKVAA